MPHTKYRPEIDGLRTIAVVAVIIFHLGFEWFPGGYLGVDVFFVISGFLISSIILKELNEGTFRFTNFWARRVRRIFPAMLAMILTTLVVIWLIGFKGLHPVIGQQSVSALFSVANLFFWRSSGDYWGPSAETFPLLHTWSLSVEEQFYLFFPIVLFFAHRFFRNRINWLLYGICTVSILLFFLGMELYPTATFYLLPTRAWELALGAVLAYKTIHKQIPYSSSNHLANIGLMLIFFGYLFVPSLGLGAVLPVVGTWLIIAYGKNCLTYRLLTLPGMVSIGRLSYSLYLWHWPVIVIAREFIETEVSLIVLTLVTLTLSIASYYLIESPARRAKSTISIALVSFLIVVLFSAALWNSDGIYDTSKFNTVSYHGYYFDLKPNNFDSTRFEGARKNMNLPQREASVDAYLHGGIIVGPNTDKPDIVVLGDSHGVMWSNLIRTISSEMDLTTSFYNMDGVKPFFSVPPEKGRKHSSISAEMKHKFDLARIKHIQIWKPKLIILVTRWDKFKNEKLGQKTIEFLASHADKVILLGQPPVLKFGNRFAIEQLGYLGIEPDIGKSHYLPMSQEEISSGLRMATKLAKNHSNVSFHPIHDLYVLDSKAIVLKGRDVVYYDDDHLTNFGTGIAKKRILSIIRKKLKE